MHCGQTVRGDVKIDKGWLQPRCCSIQQLCIALSIKDGCSRLVLSSGFYCLPLKTLN